MRDTFATPGSRRQGSPTSQRQARVIEDPTEKFLRRHAQDYEAFETHAYAAAGRVKPRPGHSAEEYRGDTSSDEAFNPLNSGLRRR